MWHYGNMWRKWRVRVCLRWTKCAEMLKNAITYAEICDYMQIFANLCINKYSKCINKYLKFWKCHYMRENMRYAHFCKICCDRMIAINWTDICQCTKSPKTSWYVAIKNGELSARQSWIDFCQNWQESWAMTDQNGHDPGMAQTCTLGASRKLFYYSTYRRACPNPHSGQCKMLKSIFVLNAQNIQDV